MASTSAHNKALWHEGDRCLAPNPKDGTFREAIIQRLASSLHGDDSMAWVTLTDRNKDEGEEEENEDEEVGVPVSKLRRPDLNLFNQEKPVFPNIVTDFRSCVPLELCEADGDRVPYTINRYLRDYQREGIRFIYNNYVYSSGCILGDDMGLGKTVQVIGFLAAVLHKTGTWEDMKKNRPQFLQSQLPFTYSKNNKVFLIVAPLSVLYNWKDELEAWGHFQCVVVHGLRKEEELARIKKGRIEIALTTYETLRICLDQFNIIDWSAVIVDEAHKIKNPSSQITQAMKELNCKVRIGLTGTILQNNLEELWCVMDWARPGCLGSLGHFKTKFSDLIEQGQRHSATKRALATGRKTVRTLARKISHLFLRRTKSLIKDQLPKKNDRVVYCSLTDFQQTVYQTVLDTEDVTLLLRSAEKCDCGSGRTRRRCCYKGNSDGVEMKGLYFSYLAILRKVANHVALLQSTAGTSKKQEKYLNTICQKVFQKFPDFVQRCKDEAFEALSDPMYSGKMKVLQKLLKYHLQKKDKMLLFSLSTKLLDVLESYCMAEGLDYSRLDGTTKSKERVQIVKDFNSSSHVNLCLVSTMAGGLGLNFVGANVVVLFDPTWNPANDLQAIDRAYRIGQCRDVTVLRLISLGTVEEVIYLRQVYKQQLQCSVMEKESSRRYFEAVQGQDVHKGELFGIQNLFRLQIQGTCLTRRILEREGRVEAGVMTSSTHAGLEKAEDGKGSSEQGDSPMNKESIKKSRDASKVSSGVLDFSSGSEEDVIDQQLQRKTSNPSAVDGTVTPAPGQMNLLQHGFSRFLQRLKEKAEGEDGSSSSFEESLSGTDAAKVVKKECISSDTYRVSTARNSAVSLSNLGTKTRDISSDSDREDGKTRCRRRQQSDEDVVKRQDMKVRTNKKMRVVWESDENSSSDNKTNKIKTSDPTGHGVPCYSEESDDFALDKSSGSKNGALYSDRKGQDCGKRTVRFNKKRLTVKTRSKYSEEIEMYTSSEDECTSVKKARSTGFPFTPPQAEHSGADALKYRKGCTNSKRPEAYTRKPKDASMKISTTPGPSGNVGTIDSILGDVQEVAYTHSNQRVVGGSKAEELISRAAVRDVFEHKMFSQLPANQLLVTQESLLSSAPDSPPRTALVRLEKPTVEYPPTFSSKIVHHSKNTTFIIGDTPQAMRRQQLEEMATQFKFPSVHQFAVEILRRDSTQRQDWLRQYYTSLNQPDLADTVLKNFPQTDSAQSSSAPAASSSVSSKTTRRKSHKETATPQKDIPKAKKRPKYNLKDVGHKIDSKNPQKRDSGVPDPQGISQNLQHDVPEPQKRHKISQQNVLEPESYVSGTESEEQEETTVCSARRHERTKTASVCGSTVYRAGGGLGVDRAGSSGRRSGEPAAAFLSHTDRDTPSSPNPSHSWSTVLSKPTAQERQREQNSSRTRETVPGQTENSETPREQTASASNNRSFLTDLIGDTSILDDLLKPKSRSSPKTSGLEGRRLTVPSPSRVTDSITASSSPGAHTYTAKGSRKDFWDILNEGNEDNINKLTDLAEVQRLCVNTSLSSRGQSAEEESLLLKRPAAEEAAAPLAQ